MDYKIKKNIKDFSAYCYAVPPEGASDIPPDKLIDCSLGINPYGYSDYIGVEKLFEQIKAGHILNDYPDVAYNKIREDICLSFEKICPIKKENFRVGTGTIGILEKLTQLFVEKDTKALGFCPQFPSFRINVMLCGGRVDGVLLREENNYKIDVEEIIENINSDYKLIYIDNPSNPTGQIIPIESIRKLTKLAKESGVFVIVDEAYGDFMEKKNSAVNIINEFDNIAVIRSASKAYGLAGLRFGYLVADQRFLKEYDKIDTPFPVSSLSATLFSSVLKDEKFLEDSRKKVSIIKKETIDSFRKIKVWETGDTVPIMIIEHPNKDLNLYEEFLKYNVFVEPYFAFENTGKNCVRMRVLAEPERIIKIIKQLEESIK